MTPTIDYSALAKAIAKQAVPYIKAQIAKDAANRYSLKADWTLPLVDASGLPAGEYHGDLVHIVSDGRLALTYLVPFESSKDRNICDGATGVPDVILGINLVPGSIAHDTIYIELEKIAKAFGVSESVVRKFADNLFTSVNLAENEGKPFVKTVCTVTHWGVRALGGLYHKLHIATALLVMLMLSGCAGCVSSAFDDPSDYRSPNYEKVAVTNDLATEAEVN